jgi:hypothetical protein
MIVVQGVLLWLFLIYTYHTLVWFIPFLFSHFPFLKQFWQVSILHIHTCKENTSTIFPILHPLHLPSSSQWYLPLNLTCFTFLYFIVWVSIHCSLGFCKGILPVNILYFNQYNPLYYSFFMFYPYLVLFSSFQNVLLCLVSTWKWYISILLFSQKKNETLLFIDKWMELENIM